ncbi:hypothetical protein LCGC14_1811320, partial [marine sediment metagenome]
YIITNVSTYSYSAGSDGEEWVDTNKATTQNDDDTFVSFNPSTEDTSDWIRLTNFGFSIPAATITGIEVEIDREATQSSSIKDGRIYLRKTSGQVGNNKSAAGYWDTIDDDSYDTYGSTSDLWGTTWTSSEINSVDFGIDIYVGYDGSVADNARIDHLRIKIYYTETAVTQATGIIRPNGDVSAQWEASAGGSHYVLIDEATLDINDFIYTSSNAPSTITDEFYLGFLDIISGIVTEIQIKVYGNETPIDSTVNVYSGGWLGAQQLNLAINPGWKTYTWTGLSLSQADLDGARIRFESVPPLPNGGDASLIGQFTPVQGTTNKYSYNWTDIQNTLGMSTGDKTTIYIDIRDLDSGSSYNLTYSVLLDFEAPTSIINIGDGITDYSLNNFGAPWTLFNVTGLDNLQGVINHTEYYYGEETSIEYQVNVLDMQNITIFSSGFLSLSGTQTSLFDLGIPVLGFEDHTKYYYIIDFKITDAAGNFIINSSYLGDSYNYDANIPRVLVSNEVSIQFENDLININDLYQGIGSIINFTLIGPDGSELKNNSIQLKSGNFYIKTTLWNETTQSYITKFDNLYDVILYSDNIFGNELYSNYEIDRKLNWDATGSDYYAFAKHASQKDPLVLSYFMQEEKTSILEISEMASFRLPNYLNYIDVYCYIWNNDSLAYDIRFTFNETDFTVLDNGTIEWREGIDFVNFTAKDDQIIFNYYGSDYAKIIRDTQKNGLFLKILIPNMYSTHSTIDMLQIVFRDFDNNEFKFSMNSLAFDKYFQNAADYKRVIPGLSELLEIPLYIDFAKLATTELSATFDITQIYSINFAVVDAPVWPGSLGMYNPNNNITIVNYPYQIFGVSELAFFDILANNTGLTVDLEEYTYDFVTDSNAIMIDPFNNTI